LRQLRANGGIASPDRAGGRRLPPPSANRTATVLRELVLRIRLGPRATV